jgi:hypothetical protein
MRHKALEHPPVYDVSDDSRQRDMTLRMHFHRPYQGHLLFSMTK